MATILRASVTAAGTGLASGDPAPILVDGSDTAITASGLQDYTPTPGDRLLVQKVGGTVEILQFISRGTVPGAVVADGSITDAKIAPLGLNPAKGIVDMRPGAFTCLIHDWRFRDATLNASRQSGLSSIVISTIAEELTHPYNDAVVNSMGNVGDAAPTEYIAGPSIAFGTVINDTFNFLNKNVVPMTITGTLNPGDTVVSVLLDVTGRIGMTDFTGIATTYLNLDPATQNAALVAGNGVAGQTRIEWIETDGVTSEYAATGSQNPAFDYYGHYDWALLQGDNFSTGHPVPKYVKVSMIWEGPTLTADAAGTHSFILPGFSIWDIGGPAYQPGTPYVRMDHNLASEEMTLLSGLPVTPGDTYALHMRRNPWSETVPYTGSGTSPSGAGEIIVRLHDTSGGSTDYGPGTGTGSFEAAGWQHQSDLITMPDNASTIDVVLKQTQTSDNSVTHMILPRLTLAGWETWTFGPAGRIHDGGLRILDSEGQDAIYLDSTGNTGGANLAGIVTIAPKNTGSDSLDRDSCLAIWTGGNDTGGTGTTQPDRVGLKLDPYYNSLKAGDTPFALGNGVAGSAGAAMVVSADRGTSGTDAPQGFVGIVAGQYPNAGATAIETGFLFDSATNTITPVGTMGASGRIPGEVIMWPGPLLPSSSWLKCDGSTVTNTAHPSLFDAMHIESLVTTSFAAGTTTFTASEGAAVTDVIRVGWKVTSVAIGGSNVATVTAVNTSTHTFTISGTTSFGGPASFWFFPFGVTSESGGVWNFQLPNYTDRFPMGASATYEPGHTGGSNSHTLTTAEMPSHTHAAGTLTATDAGHWHNAVTPDGTLSAGAHTHTISHDHNLNFSTNTGSSQGNVPKGTSTTAGSGSAVVLGSNSPNTGSSSSTVGGHTSTGTASISMSGSTASAGSGTAFDITNPFQAINFIIYTG